jgi:hypothetical protein
MQVVGNRAHAAPFIGNQRRRPSRQRIRSRPVISINRTSAIAALSLRLCFRNIVVGPFEI